MKILDSYDELFRNLEIEPEIFFEKGYKGILPISKENKRDQWKELKDNILNDPKFKPTIRKYGQNGRNSEYYSIFYQILLNIEVEFDSTNNDYPERTLNTWTKYRKRNISEKSDFDRIYNYQISHVFGRTKNPFLFTSLWNLAYIPKYLDPFTGHETTGLISNKLRPLFHNRMYSELIEFIFDYNETIRTNITKKLDDTLKQTKIELFKINKSMTEDDFKNFEKDARFQLSEITTM